MKLFSSFRPEVEEIKNQNSSWSEKLTRYAEKHLFTFYPAQHRELSRLLSLDAALVAAEVGSGKTLLASVYLALRTTRKSTSVIVAPKGVHPQWQRELERFTGRRALSVERTDSLAAGVNLINVGAFRAGNAFNRPVDLVIADEGHFLSSNSDQSSGFLGVTCGVPMRLLLSATPIPNRVEELFLQLGWLSHPTWLNQSVSTTFPYAITEFAKFSQDYGFSDGRSEVASPERCQQLLSPFLISLTKSECRSDLPPLKLRFVPCSIPESAMRSWEKCFKPGSLEIAETNFLTRGTAGIGKTAIAWQKICHAIRSNQQVLVVSVRTEPLESLKILLKGHGLTASTIYGDQCSDASEQARLFETGFSRVMLMGMKSAQSYSFPNCSQVIIIGTDFTYGMFHQTLGRCHRLSSTQPVRVDVLYYPTTNEPLGLETIMAKAVQAATVLGERDYVLDSRIPKTGTVLGDAEFTKYILRNSPREKDTTPSGVMLDIGTSYV